LVLESTVSRYKFKRIDVSQIEEYQQMKMMRICKHHILDMRDLRDHYLVRINLKMIIYLTLIRAKKINYLINSLKEDI
jgi:hypothetical protein